MEWSYNDLNILKEKFGKISIEELANILKRTEKNIKARAKKIGLFEPKQKQNFETSYVWDDKKNDYVDKIMERKSISKTSNWSIAEEEKLKEELELELKYLSKKFNKSKDEIRLKIKEIS